MLGKLARRGLRSAYAGMEFPKGKLHLDYSRVAYRWITNQTNTRTTIVALLPPGGTAVNSAPVMVTRKGGPRAEAFLLGVMSSIPFDWAARRLVEGNLTFEVISDLPVPYQHFETALGSRIIVISGALAAIDDRYSTWASAVGVATGSVKSEATRADLIAELDALVTHAFGLSREDLREIFETFHHGWKYQSRLDSVLKHYDAWAENV